MSTTVTVAVHVREFPAASKTVSVTVFAPRLAQVNELGETVMDVIPQLSLEPLLICAAVILAVPPALKLTVMFWQTAVGRTLST